MCGIIAILGQDVFNGIIHGLEQLQNRGYDSAGITYIEDGKLNTIKYASTSENDSVELLKKSYVPIDNTIGIGHTRWATHGPKTSVNSHPHHSSDDTISIVHNGIIENYKELKTELLTLGYSFRSETDSEVIANLIAYHYKESQNMRDAIMTSVSRLEGTYGLAIVSIYEPEQLYCIRHGSPLLVGYNDKQSFIVSEQCGFNNQVLNYFQLNNHDLCTLTLGENGCISISTNETYRDEKLRHVIDDSTPHPYDNWTLKEIHEQVDSSLRAISLGGRLTSDNRVKLGGLECKKQELKNVNHIVILGCGTSYFAGMFGLHAFKELCKFYSVQLYDGAEFTERDIPKYGRTAFLLLSQSGETRDLHRCIQLGKDNDVIMIGIVNVVDSLIARDVHCGVYLNAGREVAVASTKSFTSHCIVLVMTAIWFAQIHEWNTMKCLEYVKDLRDLSMHIQTSLEISKSQMQSIIPLFEGQTSSFLLGKGKGESIAREGALKMKELSYIHAEGYSTSSLKHGPFALLQPKFPVVILAPSDEYYTKAESAYEEICSRNANVIFITDNAKCTKPNQIQLPYNGSFQTLLCIVPLQLIAYELCAQRNTNPDRPRNLAKVVTVD